MKDGNKKKGGAGIKVGAVRALLRKNREERASLFHAGRFDGLGFILNAMLVLAIVALFVVFFGQFVEIYVTLKTESGTDLIGRASELMTILYTAVTLGLVASGVGQLSKELFNSDDMKIFSAMPLNARTLFVAKLITIYRSQLVISAVAVVTVNATFAWKVSVAPVFWVLSAGIAVVLPFITIGLAAVVTPIFRVIRRFLRERFVLTFLTLTGLLGIGFWLYSLLLGGVKELLLGDSIRWFFNEKVMTGIGAVCQWLYPARWIAGILTGRELLLGWLFLGLVGLVSIALSMLIIRRILGRALQARNQGDGNSMLRTTSLTERGTRFGALLKKEFLHIFRTPSYMFSYFSVALIMPLMVYFCMDVGASLVENLVGIDCNLELALLLTVLFGALTNTFCATNISRDGEMFYAVKAMPVSFWPVFASKLILCLIVTAGTQVATAWILGAMGMLSAVDALFLAGMGILFSFVNIAVATRYDFDHARFSTEDDGEIRESSGTVSAVIVMGLVLALVIGGSVLVLRVMAQLNAFRYGNLTYLLGGGLAVLAAALAGFYLFFRLKRKYYEFSGGGI